MNLFKVGRLCIKLAGRDAGKKCVVVETLDDVYVIIDGATRKRKVNVKHLEPLNQVIDIKNKANHSDVEKAFKELGLLVLNTKQKVPKERLKKQKAKSEKPVKEKKVSGVVEDKPKENKE